MNAAGFPARHAHVWITLRALSASLTAAAKATDTFIAIEHLRDAEVHRKRLEVIVERTAEIGGDLEAHHYISFRHGDPYRSGDAFSDAIDNFDGKRRETIESIRRDVRILQKEIVNAARSVRPKIYHVTRQSYSAGDILGYGSYGAGARKFRSGGPDAGGEELCSLMWETALETARLAFRPDAPSRLDCIFAAETLRMARAFRDGYRPGAAIYRIEPFSDAVLFRRDFVPDPPTGPYIDDSPLRALRYWRDEPSGQVEVLIGGAARVRCLTEAGTPIETPETGPAAPEAACGQGEQTVASRLGIDAKLEAFNHVLLGDDELGAVVRGHIYIENELIAFIKARLPVPEAIKDRDIDYSMRVKLAVALGLDQDFEPALNFVGSLRNRFAHRLDVKIGKQEADNFEKALGPHRAITSASYRQAHVNLGTEATAVPIKQQEPMDRIILCFVTLWAGILIAAHAAGLARAVDQP